MGNTFDNNDYDSPTEPMIPIILAPRSPARPPAGGQNGSNNGTAAGPTLPLQPASPSQPVPETPLNYPLLPPSPGTNHNGRPTGGASPSGNGNGLTDLAALPGWTVTPDGLKAPVQPRRSPVPTVLGVCFVVVQVLLLARVLLLLFNVNNIAAWVRTFYNLSSIFIWPFRLLLDHIQSLASIRPELVNYVAPLVAILVYGLISRILVRFLKALLNSH